ncbi:MAG: serine/threonine-protein kinase [Acidimicrobiales bacterium]
MTSTTGPTTARIGDYEICRRLARGGMGVVDLARDRSGRLVALKRLALTGSTIELGCARERLQREAEALARLNHPAIVRLLGVIDDGGEIVLVMPYLSGGTLADHVRLRGPLRPGQVHHLADRLLSALAAAHREGVIHRDIKPANVLFDEQGRAHLADFGVASLRDATHGLTATGSLVGTPEFMSPEQARGQPATPASDVFSLGATLLFAATGQPPYGVADPLVAVQRAAKGRLAPLPGELDAGLRRRLEPLVRRNPRRRPTAAAAVGGPAGTIVDPHTRFDRSNRSTRLLAGVSLAALATVVCAAAVVAGISTVRDRSLGPAGTDLTDPAPASAPSSPPCTPKPYQPCGAPAAPNTDGTRCLGDHADYDGDRSSGCEADPDTVDGQPLTGSLTANLVPDDDVDRYPVTVDDRLQLLCDGTFEVTLTAPAEVAMRVELYDGTKLLRTNVSRDGRSATVSLREPSCLADDSTELIVQVSWEGRQRTAAGYRLERSGSF